MSQSFKFGEPLLYAEPNWYQGWVSPYYKPKHEAWRAKVRTFVEKELRPHVDKWEEDAVMGNEMPWREFLPKAYAEGIFAPLYPTEFGGTPPEGGWDAFMDLIWNDEIARAGCAGVNSCFAIITMALPPILKHGSKALQAKYVPQLVRAESQIALCISEPYAGSDVAGLRATARLEGDHYVLNGEKKWITCGVFADYYTVAARTGPAGHKGLSLFLVERAWPGIEVKRLKLQGHWTSGTALVLFRDVKVPKENLIGQENQGFKYIMHNFNHERLLIAIQANRCSRGLLQQSMDYGFKRKTFGKTLLEHQVIRQKLADMAMRVESVHALLEQTCYQIDQGIGEEKLGGPCALAKVLATRSLEVCVREASQIFGGASFVRGGVGNFVERIGRDLRGMVIPGGSDEILADLAVRQALVYTQRARMEAELASGPSKL